MIEAIGCVQHDCDKCKAAEKQEPVAWMDSADDVFYTEEDAYKVGFQPIRPLYTTPPATPVQEHHGCACRWNDEGDRTVTCERHQGWLEVIAEWADRAREAEAKLKAIPPAAQRQPLTDEKLIEMFGEGANGKVFRKIARLTEAAHGITGEKT